MTKQMTFDEAADIIDVYGPDDTFWPTAEKAALNRMIANDPEFRDYVEDAKWLENLLENWENDSDGAAIDFDDEDFDASAADPWAGIDDESEGENDEDENENEGRDPDMSSMGGSMPEQYNRDGMLPPISVELDPDAIKDVDGMFQDFIRKQMENADPTEFRVFTRDFDGMVDIKLPDQVSVEALETRVAMTTGPLQKDLRRLIAARSQVKRIPGMRRGRLHAPNLHRIMSGDDRVFTRRQDAESLDTAISLLIDCSGSMSGSRMQLATEASYAIGSVLAKLGIAFECLGFTDNTNDPRTSSGDYLQQVEEADQVAKIIRHFPIVMPKFKTFEERWTIPVQRRFAHVFNQRGSSGQCGFEMGMTPEGCGLEFVARRLLARKEKRKILISMTDGAPGSGVYSARTSDDYYAYKRQSETMVKSIEASGIDLVGVGIQHDGPSGYYTNSICIQQLEEMPKQLLGLLKGFITS